VTPPADPVSVIFGDCVDVLRGMPDGSVDVVVTSPPYNQLGSRIPAEWSGRYKGKSNYKSVSEFGYADDEDEGVYQEWLRGVVSECLRVSKGLVWVNHKIRYRDGVGIHPLRFLDFPVYSEVIWDRGSGVAQNCRRYTPSHEVIYGFGTPHHWNPVMDARLFSVWRIPPNREELGKGHPCPFPVAIPRRLIASSCPPGGVVLDPFAGSGTTGHAAVLEGCRAVLIEKDRKYEPVISRRLKSAADALGEYVFGIDDVRRPRPSDVRSESDDNLF
jgi:site-specific DNA-methyltransferase (adenine-specific)